MGDRFPALKGFRPHGLTTRFRLFLTTSFARLLSGWPHRVFSLPVFCLRLLPPTCFFDRFLGDHLCFLEVRVLTTFLTIVRSGLHGNSSTREHENVRFGWQNSTKKHYLALEKHKNRSWGGRGRKFKSCHSDQNRRFGWTSDFLLFSLIISWNLAFSQYNQWACSSLLSGLNKPIFRLWPHVWPLAEIFA